MNGYRLLWEAFRRNWALVLLRVVIYVVGAYAIFYATVNATDNAFLQPVLGGLLAALLVAGETLLTGLVKKTPFKNVVVARMLIFDYFASGKEEATLTKMRQQLGQGQEEDFVLLENPETEEERIQRLRLEEERIQRLRREEDARVGDGFEDFNGGGA